MTACWGHEDMDNVTIEGIFTPTDLHLESRVRFYILVTGEDCEEM